MANGNNFDDQANWNKTPHGLVIGDTFEDLSKSIADTFSEAKVGEDLERAGKDDKFYDRVVKYGKAFGTKGGAGKVKSMLIANSARADTGVGGMDAINPHWQFGIDDDIRYPAHMTDEEQGIGLGRVYQEMYYMNQKNIYMTFGVPKFYGILDFMQNATDRDHAQMMNNAEPKILKKLANMYKQDSLYFQITLATLNFKTNAKELFRGLSGDQKVTKFYGIKPAMPMYYRLVNGMLSHLAVNMGLFPDASIKEQIEEADNTAYTPESIPVMFQENGPDIYAILDRRRGILSPESKKIRRTTQSLFDDFKISAKSAKDVYSWIQSIYKQTDALAHNLLRHIAFRLESGATPSETFSNQTGESSLASTLNARAKDARDKRFTIDSAVEGHDWLKNTVTTLTSAVEKLSSAADMDAIGVLVSGNGYTDIPEVWKGSSFSKTMTFDIQLRAPAGDKVSIFQSIYIPLTMLMAAASPRGIGQNAYTAPFLVEAFAPGVYSVPLGIIDSLTIKRGKSEFGWTHDNLPTAIDVSVSIKDLTTVLFMSMLDLNKEAIVSNVFDANTGMADYINILSGMSLADRTHIGLRAQRMMKSMLLITRNTLMNPAMFTHELAQTSAAKLKANLDLQPHFTPDRN